MRNAKFINQASHICLVFVNGRFAYDEEGNHSLHTANKEFDKHVENTVQDMKLFTDDLRSVIHSVTWFSMPTSLTAEFSNQLTPPDKKPEFIGDDRHIHNLDGPTKFNDGQNLFLSNLRKEQVDTLVVCGFFIHDPVFVKFLKKAIGERFKVWLVEDLVLGHETKTLPQDVLTLFTSSADSGQIRRTLMMPQTTPNHPAPERS